MAAQSEAARCVEEMLRRYRDYDRVVDVVSAFEWLFTATRDLPATVQHFERFPRAPALDGRTLTPDFTVVFNDATGIVGEIASFGLRDEGVDQLCHQIGGYDTLHQLPTARGVATVDQVDVLLLVPQRLGIDAVRRIIRERYQDPTHAYSPSVPPCIVQFGFDEDRYNFQRLGNPENGELRDGHREEALGRWLNESQVNVAPDRFRVVKAKRAFVNDGVDPLYLAAHLWTKTLPTFVGARAAPTPVRIESSVGALADRIRSQYGPVRRRDVVEALDLLRRAGMAEEPAQDQWTIAWGQLHARGSEVEIARVLAERACAPRPRTGLLARLRRIERTGEKLEPPLRLFDP